MRWPQIGATYNYAQLGLPNKFRAIKGLDVWDLESLDLLNGMALGSYQPYPEVLIVITGAYMLIYIIYFFSSFRIICMAPSQGPLKSV